MSIRFNCVDCGQKFSVDDSWAGKRAKCKGCGNVIQIPAATAATAPSALTPPPLPMFLEPDPVLETQQGLTPGLMILIGGLLLVGLIACVWAVLGNRAQPEQAAAGSASAITQNPPQSMSGISDPPVIRYPERPAPVMIGGGVKIFSIALTGSGPGLPMRIQLYLPVGDHPAKSLPCVFIAPAGTRMLYGSELGSGDSPEHTPYAREGFAVVAYELSGDLHDDHSGHVTYGQMREPVREFMAADGGLANARAAIGYVLAKVPEVDPDRFFAAGHSSAATMALNLVAADHRFRAVAAYAPACDVRARWGAGLAKIDHLVPGADNLAGRVSPILHVNDIACPVLLFHADDDANVPTQDDASYADALRAAGKSVQFVRVPSGGHYRSMIDEGIPAGIAFFKGLDHAK